MYPTARINQSPNTPGSTPTVYIGGAVRDATGLAASPGAVAVAGGRIVVAGEAGDVRRAVGADVRPVELPDRLLIPGLVNAHTHLELTAIGHQPYDGDFVGWIAMLQSHWPSMVDKLGPANQRYFGQATERGVALSHAAGVLTLGNITRFDSVIEALRQSPLRGRSYIEMFGLGPPWDAEALAMIANLRGKPDETIGIQPHAPYSAGPSVFSAAAVGGLALSTHLAETRDEARFVAHANGPFLDLLRAIGKWDDAFAAGYSRGQTPVQWMQPHLRQANWLCAHCNYVSDADIATLADCGATVAYCPRASEYFGHRDHRYRDMIEAGVNVCLGTDSIVCHGSLSIFDEMRRLYHRDTTDPALLLRMATVNGMRGLMMDQADATFTAGHSPGVVAVGYDPASGVDALEQVLAAGGPMRIDVLCEAGDTRQETEQ